MAVTPISLMRVSQNLRTFNLLESLRSTQTRLFGVQNQLATGLKFTTPSADPLAATAAGVVQRRLDTLGQVQTNLNAANATLGITEAAIQEAADLLREARGVASEAANSTPSGEERRSLALVVDSLLEQVIAVGNRTYLNEYLFAGHYAADSPFELTGDGVLYRGDEGRSYAIVEADLSQDAFTVSGKDLFSAVSERVQGALDLDPALTAATRISDLRGTTGNGIRLGQLAVSTGATSVVIDLTGADTVGDLVDKLNAELPAEVKASLTTRGINLNLSGSGGGTQFTVQDVGSGQMARDLGIFADTPRTAITGADLNPRLTLRTPLSALNGGAGLKLDAGITIRNGAQAATVGFSGVTTIEDVLNRLNGTETGVWARIRDDDTLEVLNRVSGADLSIEEHGGTTATKLGIRSMHFDTPLSELNDGRGIQTVAGDDLRIVTANGTVVDVDLDDLDIDESTTLRDVLSLLNTRGGGAFLASLPSSGNGIVIRDNTTGGNTLRIERLNLSPAIDGLGLNVMAADGELHGEDVNPVRVDGPLTALLELRDALRTDDEQAVTMAGERLERTLLNFQEVQGRMAAEARAMLQRSERMESEVTSAQVLLSNVQDVDLTEAIVRFQQLQTALEANLTTASRILGLSLLDVLP